MTLPVEILQYGLPVLLIFLYHLFFGAKGGAPAPAADTTLKTILKAEIDALAPGHPLLAQFLQMILSQQTAAPAAAALPPGGGTRVPM